MYTIQAGGGGRPLAFLSVGGCWCLNQHCCLAPLKVALQLFARTSFEENDVSIDNNGDDDEEYEDDDDDKLF